MAAPLRINYKLHGAGWSACTVEAEGQTIELSASYLSDALGNLVIAAYAIASGFQAAAFEITEEPGEYRWVLEARENSVLRLRILEFPRLWGFEPNESGKVLLDVLTTPLAFARAVHSGATDVLLEFGLKRYSQTGHARVKLQESARVKTAESKLQSQNWTRTN